MKHFKIKKIKGTYLIIYQIIFLNNMLSLHKALINNKNKYYFEINKL